MNEAILVRLRQAVAETSITRVAEKLAIPRCTLSLVVNGKYPANPKAILAKFDAVYGAVQCPHLNAELTRAECREFHSKKRPSGPLGTQHWRACRQCEFNGEKS